MKLQFALSFNCPHRLFLCFHMFLNVKLTCQRPAYPAFHQPIRRQNLFYTLDFLKYAKCSQMSASPGNGENVQFVRPLQYVCQCGWVIWTLVKMRAKWQCFITQLCNTWLKVQCCCINGWRRSCTKVKHCLVHDSWSHPSVVIGEPHWRVYNAQRPFMFTHCIYVYIPF